VCVIAIFCPNNCVAHRRSQQYCFWGRFTTGAPFYGVFFVSKFLGTDGASLAMLDGGTGAVAVYVVYSTGGAPLRALVYNSAYYDGSTSRTSSSVTLTGISTGSKQALRLTAPAATSRVDQGAAVTIGAGLTFDGNCQSVGTEVFENVAVGSNQLITVSVAASEALIVYLQ
jgi:hypothetical protein